MYDSDTFADVTLRSSTGRDFPAHKVRSCRQGIWWQEVGVSMLPAASVACMQMQGRFGSHEVLLCLASDYFESLLNGSMMEAGMPVVKMQLPTAELEAVLRFV